MKFRPAIFGLVLTIATGALATARATETCDPTDPPTLPQTETLDGTHGQFEGVTGHWMPANIENPTTLVVYFHGYRNVSTSWACHIKQANQHGAVSFALDYRGTDWTGAPEDNRGWFVKEGAEDSVRVANFLLAKYPTLTTVVSFGISMGGNASGLAVAQQAKRADGVTPLFDYWFMVEGVSNLAEEYAIATAVSPVNAYAAGAVADIDEECRRNYDDQVTCLLDLTLVARSKDLADSGVDGVVVVHGLDDGLVPTDQGRQISTTLRALGVPVEQYTAARRNPCGSDDSKCIDDEGGTTATQNIGDPLFDGLGIGKYPRPLAGHGWEGSDTHIVIKTAFDRLWNLIANPANVPANHEYVVDGEYGTITVL